MSGTHESNSGDLTVVARVDNVVDASVIRQILADAGIRCLVRNGDALSAYSLGGLARATDILVRAADATAARRLLADDGDPVG